MQHKYSEEELQKILYGGDLTELAGRLRQWLENPDAQPEIDYYYQNYLRKGKAIPRPQLAWENDAQQYIPIFNNAHALEKAGHKQEALKIYLQILNKYEPIGTAYYERPAIILEKAKRFDEAIIVCLKALNNPHLTKSREDFQKRFDRLKRKLKKQQR